MMKGSGEMLNEIKRLQDVITELQNSNTNLAAMIAQQTITNTNLATQIATLTTITGQLVEVQTRALDDRDQANQPTPYDDITLTHNTGAIANGAVGTHTFTAAVDWGAGLDFYLSQLEIDIYGANQFLWDYYDFFWIYLDDGAAGEYFYKKTYTPEFGVGFDGTLWRLADTYSFKLLRKVDFDQNLQLYFGNYGGAAATLLFHVSGIPRVVA